MGFQLQAVNIVVASILDGKSIYFSDELDVRKEN